MNTELRFLGFSILLGLVHILASAHAKNWHYGYRWSAGARDETPQRPGVLSGRLERALQNFGETFPLFAAAVIATHLAERQDWLTALGVQLYFWGRLVYLPLYAWGVPLVRSLAWNVATLGLVLLLVRLF